MALTAQDRANLQVGDKLWARYKGTTFTAEVVEWAEAPNGMGFRVTNAPKGSALATRVDKTASALSVAIIKEINAESGERPTATTNNAFWTQGDPPAPKAQVDAAAKAAAAEQKAAEKTAKALEKEQARQAKAAEKEAAKAAKAAAKAAQAENATEAECGECGEVFPTLEAAQAHFAEVHGANAENGQVAEEQAEEVVDALAR